ncbi:hypothetical protein [Corynebacterium mastitidis]|nr:hypothetical protein [Corynebacterium mastitidis]
MKLTTEQYAALCQAVGLDPENITVSTMVARILEHLVAAEGEGGDPQELHAQAAEGAHARAEADRLRKELTEIKAEALITNEGIKAGRLLGWQRDAWMRMAKQDYANTRKELLAMPQAVNLKERGYAGTTNTTTKNNPKWF